MVTIDKIKRGLANFIDMEIMPNIPAGSIKKTLVGTFMGLYLANLEKMLSGQTKNPFISALGIVNEDGTIDVDLLADELKKNVSDSGLKIDIDVLGIHVGDMTLHKSDIDTLKHHIKNA